MAAASQYNAIQYGAGPATTRELDRRLDERFWWSERDVMPYDVIWRGLHLVRPTLEYFTGLEAIVDVRCVRRL
eukprot:COSAG05_NODE_379_length_10567_cov_18.553687_22_plen_73_part_00